MKIYVASSWRNEFQQMVVELLRELGHEVYDFKKPHGKEAGFSWSDIDPLWQSWTPEEFKARLQHPLAEEGFTSDFKAMMWADCCVMVLPCGRSANTEAGWMKGAGKQVYVFQHLKQEPELMYRMYDGIITSMQELRQEFTGKQAPSKRFPFTPDQQGELEELHYLHKKLWTPGKVGGLSEDEDERYDELRENTAEFLPMN